MAYIFANQTFDMRIVNFSNDIFYDFINNEGLILSYAEGLALIYDRTLSGIFLNGPDFLINDQYHYENLGLYSSGNITTSGRIITGGTVNAIGLGADGFDWFVAGLSIGAVDAARAVTSASGSDDRELISSSLHGSDIFHMSDYKDFVQGYGGNDSIFGYSGSDSLNGGAGADLIDGGAGSDQLIGGIGRDVMAGGAGSDTFSFSRVNESSQLTNTCDVIKDFGHGVDKINLRAIDAFSSTTSTNDNFRWNDGTAFNITGQGEVRFQTFNNDGSTNDYTIIYIDTDGDIGAEMLIRLTGLHNLTASDFSL